MFIPIFADPNQSVANNINLFENICYAPTKRKNAESITKHLLKGKNFFPH